MKDNWVPTTDETELKVLGKFLEELGECSNAVARVLIQGVEDVEPTTKVPNRQWLSDEIADIMATASIVIEHYGLDLEAVNARIFSKYDYLKDWMYYESNAET